MTCVGGTFIYLFVELESEKRIIRDGCWLWKLFCRSWWIGRGLACCQNFWRKTLNFIYSINGINIFFSLNNNSVSHKHINTDQYKLTPINNNRNTKGLLYIKNYVNYYLLTTINTLILCTIPWKETAYLILNTPSKCIFPHAKGPINLQTTLSIKHSRTSKHLLLIFKAKQHKLIPFPCWLSSWTRRQKLFVFILNMREICSNMHVWIINAHWGLAAATVF